MQLRSFSWWMENPIVGCNSYVRATQHLLFLLLPPSLP